MPKAYWIARVTVSDPDQYKHYAEATPGRVHEIRCPASWLAAAATASSKAMAGRAMW